MRTNKPNGLFKTLSWGGLGLLTTGLIACGGGGGGAPSTGTLKLAMTDAPACGYDHVYVTVNKIRVHQSATADGTELLGWSELSIPAQRIDLLSLTNGVLQELGSLPLPAGNYQQVRLVLADNPANPSTANPLANALVLSGSADEVPLSTPSAQQSGFKLKARFDVQSGQVADMVLDFDACRSIVKAGSSGRYNLKPVVAVIPRLTTAIEGYVDPSIAPHVVVSTRDPDNNLRATVPNPITGKFTLAYLPENTHYTVVVAGQNLTTAAVTNVPVSRATGVTVLNTAQTAILPAASAMADVAGVVSNSANALLTDAQVSARQTLSTGQVLEVASTGVDVTSADYRMSLPLAAAVKAPYVQGAVLNFSTDSMVAGRYNVTGTAAGYTTQSTDPVLNLGLAGSTTVKNLVLTTP
ncbi:hypothetical protein B9Z47_06620 [Limnohabitans sp. 2KL-1]|uniref:DUF4382 domain-containing protein n=1 Tax=Limnohabitans sp. 2KL-1 TaxID=1100699 RepID=UPI000D3ABC85|nr:DUF4382 domain-containing protein [Limnohabitans sp. 2KL-1]PUE49167.1 hypothetical protein B9Z47_06620 [Limnohabitans sp. 2KL-1]